MARHKKNPKDSPFWKPEKPGDRAKGKFEHFENTQKTLAMKLTGFVKLISMSYTLTDLFSSVFKTMKKGDHVEIEYTGSARTKSKQTVHKFNAWLNGKPLESSMKFGEPASKADVSEHFRSILEK